MKKPAEKSRDFVTLMGNWQDIEGKMVAYVEDEKMKNPNPAIRLILDVLGIEAEKHCRLQQMIGESVKKEALHLNPEELATLSAHINRRLEMEDKALGLAEAAIEKSEVFFTKHLLQYLVASLKKENDLLRQFDDALKTAHISTSTGAKIYAAPDEGARA